MTTDVTAESIIAAQAATIEELQRTIKGLATRSHDVTMIEALGDYYGQCSCGAISHPHVWPSDARQWRCPLAVAEAEVAYHRARYEDRKRVRGER